MQAKHTKIIRPFPPSSPDIVIPASLTVITSEKHNYLILNKGNEQRHLGIVFTTKCGVEVLSAFNIC